MWRNREFRIFIIFLGIVSTGLVTWTIVERVEAVKYVLITCVIYVILLITFTYLRYREIERLSVYLRRVANGDHTLDLRDNIEGELSILKNDIYKVTTMLQEQQSYLAQDKTELTDAISDISHQLKTPLTSMFVMTDLLDNPNLPDEKRFEFTRNIHQQLDRIDWLVSSLLKLSKIDAGTVKFHKDQICVHDLLGKALEPVLIPIDIKNQKLKFHGDKKITFTGDFNWTVEAIINILKNCIEYTPEGGEINITYEDNILFTEIIITDTGKGILRGDLPNIFKRFYKGRSASDESVGIGLAMAYSIITSQGGDIEVESVMNEGTTFRIKFYKIPK